MERLRPTIGGLRRIWRVRLWRIACLLPLLSGPALAQTPTQEEILELVTLELYFLKGMPA